MQEDIVTIIGVDCASRLANVGITKGVYSFTNQRLTIEEVKHASKFEGLTGKKRLPELASIISSWSTPHPTVLALDAPLGWPHLMGERLKDLKAGGEKLSDIENDDHFFSRYTDRYVRDYVDGHFKHGVNRRINSKPLAIGSDKIAIPALGSLQLLSKIRDEGIDVTLGWGENNLDGCRVVEVYPKATLLSQSIQSERYKKASDTVRANIFDRLLECYGNDLSPVAGEIRQKCSEIDRCLDSFICSLTAIDYLKGRCKGPSSDKAELAYTEGWIWFPHQV